jgi:SagB-type dehydrogenase family enzyme
MDDPPLTSMTAYHQRTKHAANRYALGPAFLDWTSQPDSFRRFEDARQVALPLGLDRPTPDFTALEAVAPQPLDAANLGLFLELALGISAWKEAGDARWALRNNPSSGNLHPTEGWVILPPLAGIGDGPALYHYAPMIHGLEERCRLDALPAAALAPGGFLLALSAVPWREAWKYGERAFRYCQHDAGHAIAAASYAAACLGWHVQVLAGVGDDRLSAALGLDRPDAHHRYEAEHPDLIAAVTPMPVAEPALAAVTGQWSGTANRLSEDHDLWPVIEQALTLSHRPDGALPAASGVEQPDLPAPSHPAGTVIRHRRSAQRMDGTTGMGRDSFYRLLARTLPDRDRVPWRAFPWPPRLALMLFVHRIEGLEPGLYALIRDPDSLDRLKAALASDFDWVVPDGCPLPLYRLQAGDVRQTASHLSCLQGIAGRGTFSLGMLADFARTLREEGEWAYRRLFWEAGMVGQVLYLEATNANLAGTGIGCYFDDEVHDLLGLDPGTMDWQSLYHFTVGGALEDSRILTLPAYS